MKKRYKYSKYLKVYYYLKNFPIRLLKFKALKWKKLKFKFNKKKVYVSIKRRFRVIKYKFYTKINTHLKMIQRVKKFRIRKPLINSLVIKNPKSRWDRKKYVFKNKLLTKLSWRLSYNNFKNLKLLKNTYNFNKFKLLIHFFFKPLFNLHVFIWIIKKTKTILESFQLLNKGQVFVNEKKMLKSITLKRGDIVFFNNALIFSKINKNRKYFSFIENDFYSNKFIIIKNYYEITINDFFLSSEEYFNLRNLML